MVFTSPSWVPKLPFDPPDSVPICDFMLDEKHGRHPFKNSKPPFTCGMSGKEYSAVQVRERVEDLAKGLAKEFNWQPNNGTEWDKVIGVFTVNTVRSSMCAARIVTNPFLFNQIDTITLAWAVHRLSGISSPANAAYSADELAYQLKSSGSKALFTCLPLLPVALDAAAKSGIPRNRVYLFDDIPTELTGGKKNPKEFKTINQFIEEGQKLPALEKLKFEEGQGARQTAFLCYSSGTSGLPVRASILLDETASLIGLFVERRYDLSPQRDFQCHADLYLRATLSRGNEGTQWRGISGYLARFATTESYLRLNCGLPLCCL